MTSMLAIAEGRPAGRPARRPGPAARFVAGRAVSDCGDWLTTVAVAVGLYTVTRSLAAPALAILVRVAPRPLGALAGGHLADRFGPLPTLVVLNAARAAVTALLALALQAGLVPASLALLAMSQAAGRILLTALPCGSLPPGPSRSPVRPASHERPPSSAAMDQVRPTRPSTPGRDGGGEWRPPGAAPRPAKPRVKGAKKR